MGAFLLTVAVLSALIFAGYRLNMYLYAQGAVGASSRQLQPVGAESLPFRPVHAAQMEERDYGLRYARVGLLILAFFLVLLVVGLFVVLFSVL
jgi:hypothetical protein